MSRPRLPALPTSAVLLVMLVVEILLLSAWLPGYLTLDGLLFASQGFTEAGIIALGMTFVIVTGGIDISVGSLLALVVVVTGFGFDAGLPLPLAMTCGFATGVAGGVLNGAIVAWLRVNPLVVTLATLALFRGLALAISNARAVSGFPEWFLFLGHGEVGPVPFQLLVFAALAVALALVLSRTRYGRLVYAVGANPVAARFSGHDPAAIRFSVYALQGGLVGLAGLLYCARVASARGTEGMGLEFVVITMAIFGGARISGGFGTIAGTAIGGLVIWYLRDGIGFAGISGDWGLVITGAFLLAGVLFNENRTDLAVLLRSLGSPRSADGGAIASNQGRKK